MLLRHLRYLLAVVEHQNFTRAAEALHVSQPTLSQQIKQLEDALGAPLLDRSGRTVRPTDVGAAYIRFANQALRELEAGRRAIHDVLDLSRGLLRLAFTPTFSSYLVGPLVEHFSARYPGIVLSIRETTQDRMEAELADDSIDVGIAFADVRLPEIDCHVLFEERLSMVVGQAHPYARSEGLTLAAIEHTPLALLTRDFATRGHIDAYFQAHGVAPSVMIEANSINAVVEIVRRGRVATILPDAIASERTELRAIGLEPALPRRTVALLTRKGAYRSAASDAFSKLARSLVADWGKVGFIGPQDCA
ncbi:transcriptional regulator CynR [Trinickia fusca]|uniref:Transcriptional regulator CynR n=1 Tax=Trinickia fusca TaxID=2419777 RepID=A0A494XKU4_9BURK|nr:transcriptional regulator CynR [Trinickia fusca]RKP51218.1 transcriptional regulator CynR [Trinickia fusca]